MYKLRKERYKKYKVIVNTEAALFVLYLYRVEIVLFDGGKVAKKIIGKFLFAFFSNIDADYF